MPKKKKGHKKYNDLPWKTVNVGLEEPPPKNEPSTSTHTTTYNHYDDPALARLSNTDLPASKTEDMAMFYGLEVLDANEYQVTKQGKVVVLKGVEHGEQTEETESTHKKESDESSSDKKDNSKKKKKGKKRRVDELEDSNEADETDKSTNQSKKPRKGDRNDIETAASQAPAETLKSSDSAITKPEATAASDRTESSKKQKRKKKNKKRETSESTASNTAAVQDDSAPTADDAATAVAATSRDNDSDDSDDTSTTAHSIQQLQTSWMIATGGVSLHETLCTSLLHQSFWTPTPIQSATLAAAILGRRNVVGAAPTGSGKTFAYFLPILQSILEMNEEERSKSNTTLPLQALILAPTRELALQVSRECLKLVSNTNMNNAPSSSSSKLCGLVVGGLAHVKQRRVLEQQRPPILVATPGRLWELMSTREHEHLNNLSQLRFLVIDEADRMIQQGHFRELVQIFDAIHRANPMDSDSDSDEDEELDDEKDRDRLLGLPGIPGEARVEMLDDVLKQMEQQHNNETDEEEEEPEPVEMDDEEYKQLEHEIDDTGAARNFDEDEISLPAAPPVQRQTFVFSATLMLPPSASYNAPKKSANKRKKKSSKATTVEGAIAEILEKSRAHGPTKVVDLTSSKKDLSGTASKRAKAGPTSVAASSSEPSSSSRLPPGLSLFKIECTKKHKDSHLYAYLVTTAQGASGPCLVFCNSIAAVHRVASTLRTLRLPVRALHANMPQKARFKAVESLRDPKSRSIVVATDVAARGLDIPSVATVVHYDVARQADTFIHRAGRTARGVGEGAVGSSLSLVAPDEDKAHGKVCEALNSKRLFQTVDMDGRLLTAAQERTNLATKIVACDEVESRARRKNEWFQQAAEEAGLDLDEDLMDEGLAGGDLRDQQQLRQAQTAKIQLRELLAQPMQTQRFGKFLSSNSAAAAPEVTPYVVPPTTKAKRKKKRKRSGKK